MDFTIPEEILICTLWKLTPLKDLTDDEKVLIAKSVASVRKLLKVVNLYRIPGNLKTLKKAFKKTKLQMLLRSQNVVGYANDVLDEFIK